MLKPPVCLGCLKTGVTFVDIDKKQLRKYYTALTGLSTCLKTGFPSYLCVECATLVMKFRNFRQKCHRAYFTLQELLDRKLELNIHHIKALNSSLIGMKPNLSYASLKTKHYQEIVNENDNINQYVEINPTQIPILKFNTFENMVKVEDCNYASSPEYYSYFDDYEENKEFEVEIETKCEFAIVTQLSDKEATSTHAAMIAKSISATSLPCDVCGKHCEDENVLDMHIKMHDQSVNGPYFCNICHYYFNTEVLLANHTNENHKFKYTCHVCGEVNYEQNTAKQHYTTSCQKPLKTEKRTPSKKKRKYKYQRKKLSIALPANFKRITVSQEDQYQEVLARKDSKNYIDSVYTCELCYRGFRGATTLSNHMKKHDTSFAGPVECDMCKLHFKNTRKLYKHMIIAHLYKYACQICNFVTSGASQAHGHNRWHDNVTYKCDYCDLTFYKQSTRLSHIRIKHPSTILCSICGQGFVSVKGLYFHQKRTHTSQEVELSELLTKDVSSDVYCVECDQQFMTRDAFDKHLGSSVKHTNVNTVFQTRKMNTTSRVSKEVRPFGDKAKKKRRAHDDIVNNRVSTPTECAICGEHLITEQKARAHYKQLHPGVEYMKRYMCDQCGHTTQQYANLLVHMRRHTREKPFSCPHCDKKFSMASNRDRHIVVHTGERPYECEQCHRRFTQSWAAKLHTQTVHDKIPYKPWEKASRKRRQKLAQAKLLSSTSVMENKYCEEPVTAGALISTFFIE